MPLILFNIPIDYTLIVIIIGTGLLGIVAGILGVFALLRQQSLLGDAISHAALPGIATMFLFTNSNNPVVLLFGGITSGAIGAILVSLVQHKTTLKRDAILGMVLSVFFGIGLVLMTVIQKYAMAQQSILNKFLFGNASTLLLHDILAIGIVGIIVLLCLILFWKEFILLSFDQVFAHVIGFNVLGLEIFLTFLLIIIIAIGLQTVGAVLMSTMLIAPAAAARQWSSRIEVIALIAAIFGGSAAIIGSTISSLTHHVPTGPIIVVTLSIYVFLSLLWAPHRGILMKNAKVKT